MTGLNGDKVICCWSCGLVFLNRGSGDDDDDEKHNDDPTDHESLDPSDPKTASITPLGLSGLIISSYFRFFDLLCP